MKEEVVGVSGGDVGPAAWENALLGVRGRMFMNFSNVFRESSSIPFRRYQGISTRERYLQRGEGRRGELKFMLSNVVLEYDIVMCDKKETCYIVVLDGIKDQPSGFRYPNKVGVSLNSFNRNARTRQRQ